MTEFSYTAASCIAGVIFLSAAVVGFFYAPMGAFQRVLLALSGVIMIAPSWQADLVALAVAAPALVIQAIARRDRRADPPLQPAQ
ncbi:MAG: hypothetical protein AAFZ01_09150 [Pseudomonadota bacterium]